MQMHIEHPHRHINNVRTYITALNRIRTLLFEAATTMPADDPKRSQAFDAILTLDFMIQSNICVIDYINDLLKLNDKRAKDDLERLIRYMEPNHEESIHDFMASLMLRIKTESPQISESLKHYYLLRKKNAVRNCIAISMILCGPLAVVFILNPTSMLALIAFVLFVVVGLLLVNTYSPWIAQYEYLAHTVSVMTPSPFMSETATDYSREYKITTRHDKTTGTFCTRETITEDTIFKKDLKTTLQHRFFHGAEKLSQQVDAEYTLLLNNG